MVKFERAALMIQLAAKRRGWRVKVLGRWPALLYVVIEVPEGVSDFLDAGFAECFSRAGIEDWSFPDGLWKPELRVKVERLKNWSRVKRLPIETTVGVARVYPGGVASFEDVCDSIIAFLPPLRTYNGDGGEAVAAVASKTGAGVGIGAGAGDAEATPTAEA